MHTICNDADGSYTDFDIQGAIRDDDPHFPKYLHFVTIYVFINVELRYWRLKIRTITVVGGFLGPAKFNECETFVISTT